eukprot:6240904-Alexandrium_andersonii.AAC.1
MRAPSNRLPVLGSAGLHATPSSACASDAAALSGTPSVPWSASPALRRRRLGPVARSVTLSRPPGHHATFFPIVTAGSGKLSLIHI